MVTRLALVCRASEPASNMLSRVETWESQTLRPLAKDSSIWLDRVDAETHAHSAYLDKPAVPEILNRCELTAWDQGAKTRV